MKKQISAILLAFVASLSIFVASADAASWAAPSWQKILTCDNGAVVVDVNTNERRQLQAVIHDVNILRYLYSAGAINLSYGAQEAIIQGWTGNGVFDPGSFSDFKARPGYPYDGYSIDVRREGQGMKVTFLNTTSWTEYPGDCRNNTLSMSCESSGITHSRTDEIANWYFRDCQVVR